MPLGLNVLCQGGIHPITKRPCHPSMARTGFPFDLLPWILTRLSYFPKGAPVVIRIPGGWLPSDGPLQLLDQLAIGHTAQTFMAEMTQWEGLCDYLVAMGHEVFVYLGAPRTVDEGRCAVQHLKLFGADTQFVFDATAGPLDAVDNYTLTYIGTNGCLEGWPQRNTDGPADLKMRYFIQSNNYWAIESRLNTTQWDPIHCVLADDLQYNESPFERLHIFVEQADEDSMATFAKVRTLLKAGATVYINPNDNGLKWSYSPRELDRYAHH